jgi:hypothetical protein
MAKFIADVFGIGRIELEPSAVNNQKLNHYEIDN